MKEVSIPPRMPLMNASSSSAVCVAGGIASVVMSGETEATTNRKRPINDLSHVIVNYGIVARHTVFLRKISMKGISYHVFSARGRVLVFRRYKQTTLYNSYQ